MLPWLQIGAPALGPKRKGEDEKKPPAERGRKPKGTG
jgi:hypothetical protein